ncbi:MipA/OmpV family protein [Agarivorans sp. QJM3NY_33]|uniref:MipA/OmpV family protein n=1 Tax=Agarivorans sp. QJM3NY_33 TaxID=3421432 RepID=UPI003D7E048B
MTQFLNVQVVACLLASLCLTSLPSHANPILDGPQQHDWGIAIGLRHASIPYTSNISTVSDVVPLFYYRGERLYLDGLSAGYKLWKEQDFDLALMGRYRFFDIPANYQNKIRGDGIDFGLRTQWRFKPDYSLNLELLSDDLGHFHSQLELTWQQFYQAWYFEPYASAHLKSSNYNTRYYGLEIFKTKADTDLKMGINLRYQVWRDFYLMAKVGASYLGKRTQNIPIIDQRFQYESFLGISFFNYQYSNTSSKWPKGYLQLSHAWATPSNLGDIIHFKAEKDEYNNQLTSIFYGHLLSKTLLGYPVEVYLTPGFAYHYSSAVQDPILEYILAFKAYYTFHWPLRWRFGAAEGLSYTSNITYLEASELGEEGKGYKPSKLLNYLNFSLDLNLGDLLNKKQLENIWVGYNIHHRSGIFENSSLFGRIKGGSNYQGLHIQWTW